MPAYETNTAMQARLLSRYGITATITVGDADVASEELDSMGPFIGYRQGEQERAFPRSIDPDGTEAAETVPESVLDAVALLAYHGVTDEGPAITSKSVLDKSITYATPKAPQAISRVEALLRPYRLKVGSRL